MIDINELRRKISSVDIVDHVDIHANVKPTLTELLDRIEAAEKDIALKERVIDSLGLALNAAAHERDNLRARIEAMEQQEPVGCVEDLFDDYVIIHNNFDRAAPVYLAPGAKGEEK